MPELGPILWIIAILGGAIILGAAIAYGTMKNRKVTRAEEFASERKTREIYHKDEPRSLER